MDKKQKTIMNDADKVMEISELPEMEGKEIIIRGWVHRHRDSTGNAFVVVRDGTGITQTVTSKTDVSSKSWENATSVYTESVVKIRGIVVKDPRSPTGIEIKTTEFQVLHQGEPFPIGKDQSIEFLLDQRHLWVRSTRIMDALKVKATIIGACREFLDKRGFLEIQPPLMTQSACEGGNELFEINYFGGKAYLSQSGQLYSEAMIAGYPRVYVFAPSFRAEPSRTPRHLTEFWQLEPEMAFYNQEMNMKLQEEMVEFFCHAIAKKHPDILKKFGRDPQDLLSIKAPFSRMTYSEAISKLQKQGINVKWGDGIGLDEEKLLVKEYQQPVFLMNMPRELRPFYMKTNPDDPRTVLDADLLAPEGIGEIIGGSERISDYNELIQNLTDKKLNTADYEWYTSLRKYGSAPHSGFGMGTERVTRWLLKLDSIRDAIPFPRTMNRIKP